MRTSLIRTIIIFICAILLMLLVPHAIALPHDGGDVDVDLVLSSLERNVIHYEVNGYSAMPVDIEGKEHQLLFLEGRGFCRMDNVGHPQVPAISDSLMIPDDSRMEVRLLKSEYYEVDSVDLAPYKGPIPRSVDPTTVAYRFGPEYRLDAWFPGEVASLRDPFILHDVRGVTLDVFPFQYNPVKKVLRVYTSIEVEVAAAGPGGKNVMDRSLVPQRPDRSFQAVYTNLFLNSGGDREDPPSEDGDLLIISHGPFMAAMQPFVDWKNSNGINTTIVDVATIGNNPSAIKSHIDNVYKTSNLSYVLLVGDYNEVKTGTYGYGLSDPNYSTLTPDWYPDVFVGRFSAQTVDQVNTQVERTINYEQETHDVTMGGWNAAGMGIASNEGAGIGHYGESDKQHNDLMRDELLNYGFTNVDQIYDPGASKSAVAAGLNEGRRCVNYTGHGGNTGWSTTGFSNSDINKLTNEGMLPFVNSVACYGGDFKSGTCFGEAWLQATNSGKPTGAIAAYCSSVGQSWAEPMYGQGNHVKNNKYGGIDRFWSELNQTVGGCWFGGSCIMMEICGSSGREMFMTWHIFGDPSLRLWGDTGPKTLVADGHSIPINTPVDIHFTVQPGQPYANNSFCLLSTMSGTYPGTTLPNGLDVPLNFDAFTYLALSLVNTPVFQNFYGVLDGTGVATATFSTNGLTPINPHMVGTKLYFAAVVWPAGQPYAFATNAKMLSIVN